MINKSNNLTSCFYTRKGKNKSVSFLVSELIGRLLVPVSFLIGQVSCSYYRRLRKTKTAIALKPAVFGRLPVRRPLTLGASGTTAGRPEEPAAPVFTTSKSSTIFAPDQFKSSNEQHHGSGRSRSRIYRTWNQNS